MTFMEVKSWEDLNLSPGVLSTVKDLGFKTLTPVQAACIPLFLWKKKDVAVEAITGSGKTLAFLIPMFEILLKHAPFQTNDVVAIIITPTRELAVQIGEVVDLFLKNIPQFSSKVLIGGESVSADISQLLECGGNIIIATPGRLADIFNQTSVKFSAYVKALEILILDEADKLLDMGFEKTINTILSKLPKQRQTGLFSATQTKEMFDLIRAGLRNPVSISVKEKCAGANLNQKVPSTLSNFYLVCDADKKLNILLWFLKPILKFIPKAKCMVFFSTCASVEYFSCILKQFIKNIPVISIHGRMKKKRHRIFSEFRSNEKGLLLCTDVMARGIDIPDVHWVIQFDPPSSASSFVHRCGRTARIGKEGNALLILLPNEESFVNFLDVNQKVALEKKTLSELQDIVEKSFLEVPDIVKKKSYSEMRDIVPKIKKLAVKNREIFEKGLRAFVSFIRFYTKHECNLLFQVKDLDLGNLANGYALLKLPKMPELKNKKLSSFITEEINYEKIPYMDKTRENQRQVKLKEFREHPKQEKLLTVKKKEYLKRKKMARKMNKKKRKVVDTTEDIEDFTRDARLLKKFKKGKISKEEFDAEFATDVNEDF